MFCILLFLFGFLIRIDIDWLDIQSYKDKISTKMDMISEADRTTIVGAIRAAGNASFTRTNLNKSIANRRRRLSKKQVAGEVMVLV